MSKQHRNTSLAAKHRARIRASKPACYLCGSPIDYDLPHLDPGAFVIDHVIPLAKGGEDALSNIRAAHRHTRVQQQEARTTRRTHRAQVRVTRIDHRLSH